MKKSTRNEIISWIKSFVIAIIIAFVCMEFVFSPVTVHGVSMEPTFKEDNRLIISKTSAIERFDIIVFEAPHTGTAYIKRVIGVPGDRIEMKDDILYVNGVAYEESYVNRAFASTTFDKITWDFTLEEITGEEQVPDGYYFVLGDNRLRSEDSRDIGFIPEDAIIGEVKLQFYPFGDIGFPK